METKKRIPCYDQMKAAAIILVIMGHVTAISFGARDTILGACIGSVHLDIFFMVSGYFAYKATTNSTLKQLALGLLGKTRLLIVPLVVWSALWCVATGENIVSFCRRGGGILVLVDALAVVLLAKFPRLPLQKDFA